ncbi:thiamine pyrophosphate-binding protein [Bradyrhizobium betae]|nr:thiamine pyrophosphate-binding protein [Bradyrhizobium betae]
MQDAVSNSTKTTVSRTGAQAIAQTMQASGIELVIGYSGGGTGALIHQIATSGMNNLNARTELAGAWISYGYNRVKGRAASACLFHCVGMLHAAPAVYAAKLDSTPLVVIDINLDSSLDLRGALQDSTGNYLAMQPLAKYVRKVVVPDDLPLAIRQAVLSASTGRPGPSVLDLPYQVLVKSTDCPIEALELPAPPAATNASVNRVLEMVSSAENPVIFVGAGVQLSGAAQEVRELAELLGVTVVSSSWGGRSVMPDDHPLFGGVVGTFGWVSANEIVQASDCWLTFGVSFSQMTTGAWNIEKPSQVIQIDIDPNEIGKIFQPKLGIVADAKTILRQLIDAVKAGGNAKGATPARLAAVAEAKRKWHEFHDSLGVDSGAPINQYYLIRKMAELLPKETMIVGDSGGQAFMVYRSFRFKDSAAMPLGSRYMSLGAGLPVAIGAKLAAPEKTVVCYHGDGGFYYDLAELSTLSQLGIKVIIIIDNNHCLAANRQGMKMMGIENPWVDLPDHDFVGLAKSLGVSGERVTDPDDIEAALNRALQSSSSYLIDVVTDPATRIKRAIKTVIPILSDRKPQQNAAGHFAPPLQGSWPA